MSRPNVPEQSPSMSPPLVSIVVRTKDRPELLQKALASIASQTYRPLEVILINDGGCDLDVARFNEDLGTVRLSYERLPQSTGRAHAGNVGLERAQGSYIGFLDDDDAFYPEHVEVLASSLEATQFNVAYTSVEFVEKVYDKEFQCLSSNRKHVFEKTFSYQDLIIANYIPLMSLLFAATLLKELKFNEDFELYEDWDLLIRAAEAQNFLFINKITASYNQWGASQIAFNSDPSVIREETLKIYSRHKQRILPETIFLLREAGYDKDRRIAELWATQESMRQDLQAKQSRINELQSRSMAYKALSAFYDLKKRIINKL